MAETRQESVATVKWSGEVFTDSVLKCRDDLLKAFSEADKISLDLSDCSEIDISAIQLIIAASLEAANTGKKFSIAGSVSPQVKNAFSISGVNLDVLLGGG